MTQFRGNLVCMVRLSVLSQKVCDVFPLLYHFDMMSSRKRLFMNHS